MKFSLSPTKIALLIGGLLFGVLHFSFAQSLLDKPVTLTLERQPLGQVLKQISDQGNFYFSYASTVIKSDSLVSLAVERKPVRSVLGQLLGNSIVYKESSNYIILLPNRPVEKYVIVSGKIIDGTTQQPVDYASVYTQNLLASSLSEESGAFRLRVREAHLPQQVTIRKLGYQDTTFLLTHSSITDASFVLFPASIELDELVVGNDNGFRNFLTRLFVSSRLRRSSQNLGQFFVNLPYQLSLTPGLGTHGRMSSQIVNEVSLNIIGGYTAGTNGLELAGAFNISKQDVQYVQMAGAFNIVAGTAKGVQIAGAHNNVQKEVEGVQTAGLSNISGGHLRGAQLAGGGNRADQGFSGAQLAGAFNINREEGKGIQAAGLFNHSREDFSGIQIAGGVNTADGEMKGIQVAPFNSAGHVKGIQIGLFNRAYSSDGYSIGVLNFIKYGKSHISLASNDLSPLNLAWKTGTQKLYSILAAGLPEVSDVSKPMVSWGLGTALSFTKKSFLQIEAVQLTQLKGKGQDNSFSLRFQTPFNYFLTKRISIYAGPALTWNPKESTNSDGVPEAVPFNSARREEKVLQFGWQAGVSFYYGKIQVN